MKTKPQQFANTRVDVEKLATTITDRSGYEGDEANAYQSGIITGYERALGDNSKAVNMHDELVEALKYFFEKTSKPMLINGQNDAHVKMWNNTQQLLKQAEQK